MATLFANKLRKNDSNFGVHEVSDYHNLRISRDNKEQHTTEYDPSLSHKNIYYIFNTETQKSERVNQPTKEHIQKIREWQQKQVKATKPKHSKKSTTDRNDDIQNTKKALAKWIKADKSTEAEKKLYQEALEAIEENLKSKQPTNFDDDLLARFTEAADEAKAEGVKISRYSDKRRRLQKLIDIDFERDDKRSVNNSTRQTEYLFKIPDPNNLKWSDEQMLSIARDFKKYFKDYELLYLAIHHDENPDNPHIHFTLSNQNKKTNKYDLIQAEIEAVKTWQIENNIEPDPILNIAKTDMNEEVRSRFGELWQDFMFDIANRQTPKPVNEKKQISDNHFKKRTEEEIKEANHKYEKTKPITQREHNRQKKIQNEVKQEKIKLKAIENKGKEVVSKAISKRDELKEESKHIKQQNAEILHQAQQDIEDFNNKTSDLFDVLRQIFEALIDIFNRRRPNEAIVRLKDGYNTLQFEHNWTQEQVKAVKRLTAEDGSKLYGIANDVVSEKREGLNEKLEQVKQALAEKKSNPNRKNTMK